MRVAIVGGGATGVLAAAHLVRRLGAAASDVVVIDPGESGSLGRGFAYATDDPRHLLNVRVANMSAFADQPDHLYEWLRRREGEDCPTPFSFISRATYGDYVADLARETLAAGRARHARGTCLDIDERADGVRLVLSTGESVDADFAILATGHDAKLTLAGVPAEQPWSEETLADLSADAPILIVGCGLTRVDMALSLDRRGRHGQITATSRRGLPPSAHRPTSPRNVPIGEVPLGAALSAQLAWLRRLAARFAAEGADWRAAVDALRPHTQRLWRAMSVEHRRRFCATRGSTGTSIATAWRRRSKRRFARSWIRVDWKSSPGASSPRGGSTGNSQSTFFGAAAARSSPGDLRESSIALAFPSRHCRAAIRCCARCWSAARRARTRSASASTSRKI